MSVDERPDLSPDDLSSREDLAGALTVLRERQGMTVRDVAHAAGLPVATVGGYLSGRHLPPLATVGQFTRVLTSLGVGSDDLPAWVAAVNRLRRAPGRRSTATPAPYRGLAAYQREDAALFFGREVLTDTLVARVTGNPPTPLVVIGSSGSGKSSVLRAGLAARLGERGVPVVVITPGAHPLATLEQVRDTGGPGDRTVLVVDQFEEVFASERTPAETLIFLDRLDAIHRDGAVVVIGLRADFFDRALELDLLAHWLGENQVLVGPLTLEALRRVVVEPARAVGIEVEDALLDVLLSDATTGSPSPTGAGLDPGVLPLLSHALYVTWLTSSGRRLTLAHYREAGGLAGAIAKTAEEVYESLTEAQRGAARRTLLRLVRVRDGAPDTRRPADRAEFTAQASLDVVAACVDARLLTSDRGHVQLAHEALINAWPRFRVWLAADRDGLRTHGRLTEAVDHWLVAGRDPDLLYRGSALEVALSWVAGSDGNHELTAVEREFLEQSTAADAVRVLARRRSALRLRALAAGLGALALSTGGLATATVVQSRAVGRDRDLAVSRQLAVTSQSLAGTDTALAVQVAVAAYRTADTVEARTALLSASGRTQVARLAQTHSIVNSLDVSPDGSVVALATDASTLVLWSTGVPARRIASVTVPDKSLYAVSFSAVGHLVAVGGDGGRLEVWSVADPSHPVRIVVTGADVGGTIYDVAFSADGTTVAAAASDGTVHLWTIGSDDAVTPAGSLPALGGTAQAVAVSRDGRVVAEGGSQGAVALWDVADPSHPVQLGATFAAADGPVTSVAMSPDGHLLAVGARDSRVHLWSISDRAHPTAGRTLTGPTSWVNHVRFSADGTFLGAASSDKRVWVWDVATGAVIRSLVTPTTGIAVGWAPDGADLFSSGADGVLREWTFPGPTLSGFSSIPGEGVFGAHVLAAATTDGVRLWDATHPDDPTLLSLAPPPGKARLDGAVAVSDVLHLVVAGDTSGAVHFWDISDPKAPRYLTSVQAHTDWVESVSFDASGTRMSVTSDDASITLWDLSHGVPGAPTSRLGDLGGMVYSAAFSPDARTMVASVLSGHVLMIDVSDLAHPRVIGAPITGPVGYVYSAAFSPDGHTIAAGGNDGSIWLWDVRDPARPTPLGTPLVWADGYAANLAFSPDGRLLAAAMTDGTVRLWDVATPSRPVRWASLDGISGSVYGVAFSPDGAFVSGAGADKTVRIWDTSLSAARATVCASALHGVPISATEWSRVVGDVPFSEPCGSVSVAR